MICLPRKVQYIINQLSSHGYEAYAVGGCIRDSILGRDPKDWDITTSAVPVQMKALFSHTVDTGIQHGTVTVMLEGEAFEVTTYRLDGAYLDGRHPLEVRFTGNLREDLRRRDFTINAMAYNDMEGIVDLFGGVQDINDRIIRCVGNPEERFAEDALRILRGLRFAAQLGFQVNDDTKKAMKVKAETLRKISAERIQSEICDLVTSQNPRMLMDACSLGITKIILPEFDRLVATEQETPHHCCNVGEHTLRAMSCVEKRRHLRYAVLFHDMGKPLCKTVDGNGVAHFKGHAEKSEAVADDIMKRLKFDNASRNKIKRLVKHHDYRMPITEKSVRKAVAAIGEDIFEDYLKIRMADTMAQSSYLRDDKLEDIEKIRKIYMDIRKKGQCLTIRNLAVNGHDLMDAGMKPGKEMGEKLSELLQLVLENPELNSRDELLKHL